MKKFEKILYLDKCSGDIYEFSSYDEEEFLYNSKNIECVIFDNKEEYNAFINNRNRCDRKCAYAYLCTRIECEYRV